jgi:hypothetical protein
MLTLRASGGPFAGSDTRRMGLDFKKDGSSTSVFYEMCPCGKHHSPRKRPRRRQSHAVNSSIVIWSLV